jgi:ion channel-forming bestrophin family protein
MINYNPKDWFRFIFRFHKGDTFRKLLPMLAVIGVYSWLVAYLEMEVFHITDKSFVRNIPVLHNLLGFAISMLLVFRTNTAYDRWWEGRKLWGALVNNSRNLAIKLSVMLPKEEAEQRAFFLKIIPAYAFALHDHLKSEETRTALFETKGSELVHKRIDHAKHVPNQIATLMFMHIQQLYKEGKIDGSQLIILNAELQSFTDICGACERIKNTPIPFSYSIFIKKFIFLYIITLPIGYVFSLSYYVIPVVMFIFYVLASLELIAEEIEDPFGNDHNDVPTKKIAENIDTHIHEIL